MEAPRHSTKNCGDRHLLRKRRGQRVSPHGFTFIEVLATIALLAIALPSVMNGFSVCLSAAGAAKQRSQAAALAQDKLAELLATGDVQSTQATGDFSPEWPQYRWKTNVGDCEVAELRQLELVVEWTDRGRARNVTLTTWVPAEGSP